MDFSGAYEWPNLRFLLQGFWVTLQVAGLSIVFSFILGTLLGTLRYTRIPVLSQIVAVIVDTIRNLPLLLIIFLSISYCLSLVSKCQLSGPQSWD